MPKVIGVDFDDVLIAFNEALCEWHNKEYGTSLTKADVVTYDFGRTWGCSTEESVTRVQRFFQSIEHRDAIPVEGAIQAIEILGEERVYIVTARPHEASSVTTQLIEKYFPRMVGRIHYVGKTQDYCHHVSAKAEICIALGIEFFIDDALVHAQAISDAGIPVLLFDNPWNQTDNLPCNIIRVHSWGEIVERLK